MIRRVFLDFHRFFADEPLGRRKLASLDYRHQFLFSAVAQGAIGIRIPVEEGLDVFARRDNRLPVVYKLSIRPGQAQLQGTLAIQPVQCAIA